MMRLKRSRCSAGNRTPLGVSLFRTPLAPVANFIADETLIEIGNVNVVFTDLSAGSPTEWLWERREEGGEWEQFAGEPTVQNPTEVFSSEGETTWDIRLTATNAYGSDTETKLIYIQAAA